MVPKGIVLLTCYTRFAMTTFSNEVDISDTYLSKEVFKLCTLCLGTAALFWNFLAYPTQLTTSLVAISCTLTVVKFVGMEGVIPTLKQKGGTTSTDNIANYHDEEEYTTRFDL